MEKKRNLWVISTDKPSRLHFDSQLFISPRYQDSKTINSIVKGRNIYITSNEIISPSEWCIDKGGIVHKFVKFMNYNHYKKIILTTDQDLIADGIEQISEDVLLKILEHINSGKNIESFDEL